MKIGVVSSSSPVREEALEKGIRFFESAGDEVVFSPHLFAADRFLAGTDEARATELTAFFADPSVDVIIEACGGYGSQRILPLLDYDFIKAHRKPLIGLSDSTAVQNALAQCSGVVCPSGFLFKDRGISAYPPASLAAFLNGKSFALPVEGKTGAPVRGKVFGGCLSLFTRLLGTPYMPDCDGAILVLEDVGEEPYAVDRMLSHLELAGIFDKAAAVVFGVFRDCTAKNEADGTVENVLAEWTERLRVPVFKNLPYGHHPESETVLIGADAVIENGAMTFNAKDKP